MILEPLFGRFGGRQIVLGPIGVRRRLDGAWCQFEFLIVCVPHARKPHAHVMPHGFQGRTTLGRMNRIGTREVTIGRTKDDRVGSVDRIVGGRTPCAHFDRAIEVRADGLPAVAVHQRHRGLVSVMPESIMDQVAAGELGDREACGANSG